MRPLTRQGFKGLVAEVIREEFNLGLRHDVLAKMGSNGTAGLECVWMMLRCSAEIDFLWGRAGGPGNSPRCFAVAVVSILG